jgi:hypothetical protein
MIFTTNGSLMGLIGRTLRKPVNWFSEDVLIGLEF